MAKPPIKRPGRNLIKRPGSDLTKKSGKGLSKRPSSDLTKRAGGAVVAPTRPLAVFDWALPKSVLAALAFGNHTEMHEIALTKPTSYTVGPAGVPIAKHIRAKHVPLLESADQANRVLQRILSVKLDREIAVEMIGMMLDAFHTKTNPAVLAAMVDLIEGDDIARALQSYYISRANNPDYNRMPSEPLWKPIEATPAALALACRTIIATSPKYVPHPAELGNAVRTAQAQLRRAQQNCETVVELIQIADAVMLEFAPREEWFKPWQPPHRRLAYVRMLRLHEKYGDAREQYPGQSLMKGLDGNYYEDADGNEVNGLTAFGELVKDEQVKFKALMGPVEFKRITEQILAEDKVEQPMAPLPKRIVEQIATETIGQLQAPAQPKRVTAARKRSLPPPVSDPLPDLGLIETREKEHVFVNRDAECVNRDGLTESDYEERVGWGGYGIGDDGLVHPFSEDD